MQRNTKAKKHATSNVGSLKLIKPSSVIRLSCMSVTSEDRGCVFTMKSMSFMKIIRSRRSIILCEIESVLNCDLHCNKLKFSELLLDTGPYVTADTITLRRELFFNLKLPCLIKIIFAILCNCIVNNTLL